MVVMVVKVVKVVVVVVVGKVVIINGCPVGA